MTKKKVLSEAPQSISDETPVTPAAVPRKRAVSTAQKSAAKLSAPTTSSAGASVTQAPSDPAAKLVATSTKKRPPARSVARAAAPTQVSTKAQQPAKPKAKVKPKAKTNAPRSTPDQTVKTQPMVNADTPPETAIESKTIPAPPSEHVATEQVAPSPKVAPELTVAELWEQGSPIRIRIAQLRTRNSLLEEQLQRLRPPVQVRGKKK